MILESIGSAELSRGEILLVLYQESEEYLSKSIFSSKCSRLREESELEVQPHSVCFGGRCDHSLSTFIRTYSKINIYIYMSYGYILRSFKPHFYNFYIVCNVNYFRKRLPIILCSLLHELWRNNFHKKFTHTLHKSDLPLFAIEECHHRIFHLGTF